MSSREFVGYRAEQIPRERRFEITAYYCGVDVGASTTKSVIINEAMDLKGFHVMKSGVDFQGASEKAFHEALKASGVSKEEIRFVVATGYGRKNVPFSKEIKTEISCHMKGCYHYHPKAMTIVDIGGQDSKIIKVDHTGKRLGFKMNRKCAAGTGAFLEELAARMDIPLEQFDRLARDSTKAVKIGSYCTVFTSTEVLAKIRGGVSIEDLVCGIFESVIKRILEMDSLDGEVMMTGGVIAHNPVLAELLEERLNKEILFPPKPQITGAFGAALYGLEISSGS